MTSGDLVSVAGLCDKILAGPNRNMYKLKEEYSQSAAMPEEPAA